MSVIIENWRDDCSVVHKGKTCFAVMREDGHVINADSFDELIEAVKNDAKVRRHSKNNIVWITRNGRKIPIRAGRLPNGQRYVPQVGSQIVVQGMNGQVKYVVTGAQEFRYAVISAKSTVKPEAAWRVDDTHKAKDFKKTMTFTTEHGSTVAVKQDGDIISVCKKRGDTANGTDLLKFALANGGNKLDSFSGNFEFYCKNGFEPVSWTRFVERYAPHDWVKSRDLPEEIVFFKYTGKNTKITCKEFIASVPESIDYDAAKMVRDRSMQ